MITTYHNAAVNSYDSFSCYLIKLSLDHELLVGDTVERTVSEERDDEDVRE